MEDEWQLRKVRVPDGMHLSDSKDTKGAQRDLLRDDHTNKLRGPAESLPVEDDDPLLADRIPQRESSSASTDYERSPGIEAFAEVAFVLAEAVAAADIDWGAVTDRAFVSLRQKRNRAANRVRAAIGWPIKEVRPGLPDPVPVPESSHRGHSSPDTTQPGYQMSSDEYRERVVAVLAAEEFAAWQRDMLRNATVTDSAVPAEMLEAVQLVLEGRGATLDEASLAAVTAYLRGTIPVNRARQLSSSGTQWDPPTSPAHDAWPMPVGLTDS